MLSECVNDYHVQARFVAGCRCVLPGVSGWLWSIGAHAARQTVPCPSRIQFRFLVSAIGNELSGALLAAASTA